jgi:Zn finger protein HypA/HybF involved in hydrogenase expression
MNRLVFHCLRCDARGPRDESRKPKPDSIPGFVDECPNCHSQDVEVSDPSIKPPVPS